jgi:hypothetical protein
VGFPIRKSADQRLFAPPHGLSQRTTSFIASQRQGIHRIPLRHLIALIIDVHLHPPSAERMKAAGCIFHPTEQRYFKDQFASNIPGSAAVSRAHNLGSLLTHNFAETKLRGSNRIYFLFTMSKNNTTASDRTNVRRDDIVKLMIDAQATGASILQAKSLLGRTGIFRAVKNGGAGRDRTDDLKLAKLPLSQLSYGPELSDASAMQIITSDKVGDHERPPRVAAR